MAKRRTQLPPADTTITVGLDIGYGVTKAVTPFRVVTFPSVMGNGREITFRPEEITQKYPGMQLYDANDYIFIGELALSQLRQHEQRVLRGRTVSENDIGNEFRRRLMLVALGQLLPDAQDVVHIRIATGLPVDHMRDAGLLKAALMGTHRVETDQVSFVANVIDVMVMPQPYGTIYSQQITPDGAVNDCYTWSRTGVIDVGTYTIDFAVDDDGEYISAESRSEEAGVWTVQERIAQLIEREFREKPGYRLIEDAMRNKCLTVRGERKDFRRDVDEAVQPLQDIVINAATSIWKSGLNLNVIWLAGGGAPFIRDVITEYFPHARIVDEPQLANARGYLNYARFAETNQG